MEKMNETNVEILDELKRVCEEKGIRVIIDYDNLLEYPIYFNALINRVAVRANIGQAAIIKFNGLLQINT